MNESVILEPKGEIRKYKLKSFQQNLMRLKIENGASGKCWKLLENDRIELENILKSCKFRIDQLETAENKFKIELEYKQVQLEKFEKQNNDLILKNEKLTTEKKARESELSLCKSRISKLETENRRHENDLRDKTRKLEVLKKCEFLYSSLRFKILIGYSSINITVVSGVDGVSMSKTWYDKNLSGCYRLVQITNDRPVYKVSFHFIRHNW